MGPKQRHGLEEMMSSVTTSTPPTMLSSSVATTSPRPLASPCPEVVPSDVVGVIAEFLPSTTECQEPLMLVNTTWYQGVITQSALQPKLNVHWPLSVISKREPRRLRLVEHGSDGDIEELVVRVVTSRRSSTKDAFERFTSLSLERCYTITENGLSHISRLSMLTHLNLTHCVVTDATLAQVCCVSSTSSRVSTENEPSSAPSSTTHNEPYLSDQLISLKLCGCEDMTWIGLSYIVTRFTRLQHLDVSRSGICDRGLMELRGLQRTLTSLCLDCCSHISDSGMRFVGELELLEHLSFPYTPVTLNGFIVLNNLVKLTSWDTIGCEVPLYPHSRLRHYPNARRLVFNRRMTYESPHFTIEDLNF